MWPTTTEHVLLAGSSGSSSTVRAALGAAGYHVASGAVSAKSLLESRLSPVEWRVVPGGSAVGVIRKMASVSTLGAVDFRSDKERIARYTKATKKEAKKQTQLMYVDQAIQMGQLQRQTQLVQLVQQAPGWFPAPDGAQCLVWWDGTRWTDHTAPLAAGSQPAAVEAASTTVKALPAEDDVAERLRRLSELHAQGLIADDEFTSKRAGILEEL